MKINIANSHANQYLVNDYNKAISKVFEISKLLSERNTKHSEMKENLKSIDKSLQILTQNQIELKTRIKELEQKIIENTAVLKQLNKKSADYEELKQTITEQTLLFGNLKNQYGKQQEQIDLYNSYKNAAYEKMMWLEAGNKEYQIELDQALTNLQLKAARLEAKINKNLFFEFVKAYAKINSTVANEEDVALDLSIEIASNEEESCQ